MRRYYSLLDCIMWTTDLYRYIQESTDAMIWASATSVSYDELTFTDFSFVGANCFVCTVRYKADFTANSCRSRRTTTCRTPTNWRSSVRTAARGTPRRWTP